MVASEVISIGRNRTRLAVARPPGRPFLPAQVVREFDDQMLSTW